MYALFSSSTQTTKPLLTLRVFIIWKENRENEVETAYLSFWRQFCFVFSGFYQGTDRLLSLSGVG